MNKEEAGRVIAFLSQSGKLKNVTRAGWQRKKIKNPESVAEHSFRVGLFVIASKKHIEKEYNFNKCLMLALIHDLAELKIGDITKHDGISVYKKQKIESDAMKQISNALDKDFLYNLWKEFEYGKNKEARLIKDFDVIEMVMQAQEYKKINPSVDLKEFFSKDTLSRIKTKIGKKLLNELLASS